MKLVEDWRQCWKWLSVIFSVFGIVATGLWDLMPALQQIIPPPLMVKITLVMFTAIAIGRVIKQFKEPQ